MKIDSGYLETHYEVVSAMTNNETSEVLDYIGRTKGRGGMYELAEELTTEFLEINKDRVWDGDYFDELELFLSKKL